MKLHPDRNESLNTITAYGDGYFEVNAVRHEGAVLVTPEGPVARWDAAPGQALTPAHLAPILSAAPEVVLLGTGATLRFPARDVMVALQGRGIGIEAMDSAAACRTYNVLMAEGRRVLAALLPY